MQAYSAASAPTSCDNGKDGADQQLLDVLGALRRAVEREHAERGGHRVHDADDGFLLDVAFIAARQRKEHRPPSANASAYQ